MYHRILIASDPEGLAEQTVPIVAALAGGADVAVRVVAVAEEVAPASRRRDLAEHLDRVLAELRRDGVSADGSIRTSHRDHISSQIASAAREWNADLIVLGSHRRGELRSLFVGSVGHAVARRTKTPLLFAGSRRAASARDLPPPDQRCILVAIDYDEASQHAIEAAIAMSSPKTRVHVIHVQTLPGTTSIEGYVPQEVLERDHDAGRYLIEGALQRFADRGIHADWELFEPPGRIAEVIAQAADDVAADVIVLGSRRLATAWALVAGSVAHDVIALTPRSVLLAGARAETPGSDRLTRTAGAASGS